MKVLVVGAGAIGGTVAVLLKKEGYDIRIKCHIPEIKELIETKGFYLHGAKGEHHVDFKCYHEVEEFGDEKFDIIIIATKYAHVAASAKLILPYLAEGGIIVGMQNGILTEELAEIVGRDKTVGCMIGFVNGFCMARFKLHPFIVTLSTQLITYGIILWFFDLNGNNGAPIGGLDKIYKDFLGTTMFKLGTTPVPLYVLYAVILTALMWFIWNKTTFGKNMFAVGSNAEAAKVSGVNVFLTTMLVHTLAGAMYGYSGFVEGFRSGSIAAGTGANYECDAIAACVIGGVSFVGGTGKISGIILGVVVLRLIFVALTMLGVDSSSLYIIKGAIILCACALDMRKYLVKK